MRQQLPSLNATHAVLHLCTCAFIFTLDHHWVWDQIPLFAQRAVELIPSLWPFCFNAKSALLPITLLSISHRLTTSKQHTIFKFSIEVGCLFFRGYLNSSQPPTDFKKERGWVAHGGCLTVTHTHTSKLTLTRTQGLTTMTMWEGLRGTRDCD